MSDLQSRTITILRFPLIVGVIFIHTLPGIGVPDFLGILFSKELTQISVPTFYFLSGYLFFGGKRQFDKYTYELKIKSRVESLFLPFIAWLIISVQPFLCIHITKIAIGHETMNNLWNYCWNMNTWVNGPFNYHLWFLRELIIVSLASPIIYWAIMHFRKWCIIALLLIYMVDLRPNTVFFSSQSFLFFSWGAYYRIACKKEFVDVFRTYSKSLLCFSLCIVAFSTWACMCDNEYSYIIHKVMIISGVPTIILLGSFFAKGYSGGAMSQSSFFVYLSHVYFIPITGYFTTKLYMLDNVYIGMLTYMLRPFLIAFLCVSIYVVLSKIRFKYFGLLTGNR